MQVVVTYNVFDPKDDIESKTRRVWASILGWVGHLAKHMAAEWLGQNAPKGEPKEENEEFQDLFSYLLNELYLVEHLDLLCILSARWIIRVRNLLTRFYNKKTTMTYESLMSMPSPRVHMTIERIKYVLNKNRLYVCVFYLTKTWRIHTRQISSSHLHHNHRFPKMFTSCPDCYPCFDILVYSNVSLTIHLRFFFKIVKINSNY